MKKLLQFLLNYLFTHSLIHSFTHSLKKYLFPLSFFLLPFLVGCSTKTTPIFVTINSPNIKVSDEGFLKEGFGYKEIIIYKAGNAPVRFTLKKDKICVNNKCFNKYLFIKRYFNGYSKDFFDKILAKEPLTNENIKKTSEGFVQKSTNFIYIVKKNSVLFKDKSRHIIVFIKYLKEKG